MTPEERASKIWNYISQAMQFRGIGTPERGMKLMEWIVAEIREAEEEAYDDANKDFNWLQSAVGKVYCHFTENKLSKWNYEPNVIISEIEDCQNQFWEKEIEKAKREGFEMAREMAAEEAQTFKWTDDNDSEVTEIIAYRIRAMQMPDGSRPPNAPSECSCVGPHHSQNCFYRAK